MVYSERNIPQTQIESFWLPYGALRVNEALGGSFTIPFSSNNVTARDLSIHYGHLGILLRTRNETDSEELQKSLEGRIEDIIENNKPMVLEDGTRLFSEALGENDSWSNNENYNPTFDMRDAEDQRVDPELIDDTWDNDNAKGW
jgi:tRNA A37 N6-isopentenylltransferase MiaA